MTERAEDAALALAARRPRTRWHRLGVARYAGVLVGLIAVCAYLWATEPIFMTWDNWQNILRAQAVVLALGIGMTFVLLSGGIDLSIASTTAAAAMVVGIAVRDGAPGWLACLAGIGVGLLGGLLNGAMIGKLRIPFFVVTLGTLSIYQSFALVVTNGETISLFSYGRFAGARDLINGSTGPFPTVILLAAGLYLLAAAILHYTSFGRAVYAVGSNAEAARLAGINVTGVLVAVYAAAGLSAGIGAVVLTGRLTAAGPQTDPNLMLTVVAAVLIGGTAFTGGDGGLAGTVVGILFLGVIQNGLSLSNVSTFWQGTVSGLILIVAVGLGVLRKHGVIARLESGVAAFVRVSISTTSRRE